MKKSLLLVLALVATLVLAACGDKTPTDDETILLKINMAAENDKRLMTYLQANPLEMPDGSVINSGDLKPLWQMIETALNIDIQDNAIPGQRSADMFDLASATQFAENHIYGGNNLGEKLMSAGTQGYFVNLATQLDKMPNFSAYLDANPLVKSSITAYDGGIYHIPYIAEIDNYARMTIGRYSWVTALLDGKVNGEAFALETETATLNVAYDPYWVDSANGLPVGGLRHTTNVVTLQNQAATSGVLNQATALQVLKDYIQATYPTLENLSDLYLGETAQYDMDELVALWRVIKLSPRTLSKEASGVVKTDAVIWPYFVRQANYREEFLRLQNFFGGQRVHGSDSYGSRLYTDKDGNLNYSYYDDDFLDNLNRLKAIMSEGLADERIAGAVNTTNLRTGLIFSDSVETNRVYGFMTYDFTSSTTAMTGQQDDVKAFLPPLTTTPASNGEWVHYLENSRVVKPDGWSISKSVNAKELNAALKLFDYFFTEDGNAVQNYGTPDLWRTDEVFVNPADGVEGPLFTQWTLDKAAAVANGDMSTFLRDHIGALIPIGFQKEIGFEIQSTSANGIWSWQLYYGANNGAGVIMNTYSADNPYYQLVPPIFSLTNAQNNILRDNTSMTSDTQLIDRLFGFLGSKDGEGIPTTSAEVKQMFVDSGVETYIAIYRAAFAAMQGN